MNLSIKVTDDTYKKKVFKYLISFLIIELYSYTFELIIFNAKKLPFCLKNSVMSSFILSSLNELMCVRFKIYIFLYSLCV